MTMIDDDDDDDGINGRLSAWWRLPAEPVVVVLIFQLSTDQFHGVACRPVTAVVGPRRLTQ